MKPKSYMVAVQVVLKPTVYIELVATSQADALRRVEEMRENFIETHMELIQNEIKIELGEVNPDALKLVGCGISSRYHDKTECKICSKLANQFSN